MLRTTKGKNPGQLAFIKDLEDFANIGLPAMLIGMLVMSVSVIH